MAFGGFPAHRLDTEDQAWCGGRTTPKWSGERSVRRAGSIRDVVPGTRGVADASGRTYWNRNRRRRLQPGDDSGGLEAVHESSNRGSVPASASDMAAVVSDPRIAWRFPAMYRRSDIPEMAAAH